MTNTTVDPMTLYRWSECAINVARRVFNGSTTHRQVRLGQTKIMQMLAVCKNIGIPGAGCITALWHNVVSDTTRSAKSTGHRQADTVGNTETREVN